jgi:dienelactone hydrolase
MARRRRWLRPTLIGLAIVGGIAALAGLGNTVGRYAGWTIAVEDPQALLERLRPHYRVMKPDGAGPFPTALLYSGCDGPKDNLERWGRMLNERGWAAIVVDSHGPLGYLRYEIWRLTCAGQLFMGSERAGDVLLSLYDARRMPFVDRDKMVLIGSSHGGWAVMELLAFAAESALPYGLSALPPDMAEEAVDGVVGVILPYPYCGAANRARRFGWSHAAPVLFLLATDDVITPAEDCREIAELLAALGLSVEVVSFGGVTHGFDQVEHAAFSLLEFDAAATEKALRAGGQFLDRIAQP